MSTALMPQTMMWKPRKENYLAGLEYMKGRLNGTIKSLKTPWTKFNDASVDGIEWQTTLIIAGRPGSLKTTLKDSIINASFDLNRDQKFRVLDFQFEMVGRVTALREFSTALKKSYKTICNADKTLTKEDIQFCLDYANKKAKANNYPVDIVDLPCTVKEFENIVTDYMEKHKEPDGTYVKTVIGVDHSLLFEIAPFEGDEHAMLRNFGKCLTKLKKKFPIIFIVLSQLNRNIEAAARLEQGKYANHIQTSDIYGSDALLMHADMIVGLSRPALANIEWFGNERFKIEDDTVLVVDWLKFRSGGIPISFFKIDYNSMSIYETEAPIRSVTSEQRKKEKENRDLFNQTN